MEEIKSIYEDNCRWLAFAEAKHTVLMALNIALLALLMTKDTSAILHSNYICIVILCLCSIVVSVLSLLPFANKNDFLKSIVFKYYRKRHYVSSIIFYKEIFLMKSEYPDNLRMKIGKAAYSDLEYEWVNQIMEIASIVTIKVAMFKLAGILAAADIVLLGYSLI